MGVPTESVREAQRRPVLRVYFWSPDSPSIGQNTRNCPGRAPLLRKSSSRFFASLRLGGECGIRGFAMKSRSREGILCQDFGRNPEGMTGRKNGPARSDTTTSADDASAIV